MREKQLFEELKSSKQEVASLRLRLTSEYVVHDQKCKNCAKYSAGKMDRLVTELEKEKSKVRDYREMYENAERNTK